MTTNKYFNNFSYDRTQDLADDLIVEAIKIYGHDCRYLPRTIVKEDKLLGEDPLSTFDVAVPIEMYVKNLDGFDGIGDFVSAISLEIKDQITLTMARSRWPQLQTENYLDETGYDLQNESANTRSYGSNSTYVLEDGNAAGTVVTTPRPMEGDLVYIPMIGKIYEVRFVEHEAIFYQFGKLYTYDLTCELFTYSSDRVQTGNTAIDGVVSGFSMDALQHRFVDEDGNTLLDEDGDPIIDEYRIEDTVPTANNEYISSTSLGIIEPSDSPFSDTFRFGT